MVFHTKLQSRSVGQFCRGSNLAVVVVTQRNRPGMLQLSVKGLCVRAGVQEEPGHGCNRRQWTSTVRSRGLKAYAGCCNAQCYGASRGPAVSLLREAPVTTARAFMSMTPTCFPAVQASVCRLLEQCRVCPVQRRSENFTRHVTHQVGCRAAHEVRTQRDDGAGKHHLRTARIVITGSINGKGHLIELKMHEGISSRYSDSVRLEAYG